MTLPLVYVSEARVPSRSSNSMQTMRMCAAFAEAGAEVTLLHLADGGEPPEGFRGDVEGFYGVPANFRRVALPGVTAARIQQAGRLATPLRAAALGRPLAGLALRRSRPVAVYTRSYMAAAMATRLRGRRSGIRTVWGEIHDVPRRDDAWRAIARLDGLVVISRSLGDVLAERAPRLADRIRVEHDGVDLASVDRDRLEDPAAARRRLGIGAGDGPVVVYTGRVNRGKGADVLLAAAERLRPAIGAAVVLVGKVYDDAYLASPHATFTGFVPPSDVPAYLAAADVLVMPSTEELQYAAYTSPLKLFEYMAAGRPIVASALAGVREVLRDGENALLYPPADAAALAAAVRRLHEDPALARRLADRAHADVQEYAWRRRAERILAPISDALTRSPA